MSSTFAHKHSLPERSVLGHDVLREAFFDVRSTISCMRKELKLGAAKIGGNDIQLVDEVLWDRAIRREKETRNRPIGYYFRDEHRCYVRYDSGCESKDRLLKMQAHADCASVMSHEMLHHASGNGLRFSATIDEAITEWLNEDSGIIAAIRDNTGRPPDAYSYEAERKMWSIMRAAEPRIVPDLERCYWTGNGREAMRIIRRKFGEQILSALKTEKSSAKKVITLIQPRTSFSPAGRSDSPSEG